MSISNTQDFLILNDYKTTDEIKDRSISVADIDNTIIRQAKRWRELSEKEKSLVVYAAYWHMQLDNEHIFKLIIPPRPEEEKIPWEIDNMVMNMLRKGKEQ